MSLVRPFHCERIALLAVPQSTLTGFDTAELPPQHPNPHKPKSATTALRAASRIASSRHGCNATAFSRVTARKRGVSLTLATAMNSCLPSIGLVSR